VEDIFILWICFSESRFNDCCLRWHSIIKPPDFNLVTFFTQIHNINISSTPHRTLNTSRGIIRYRDEDLDNLSDEEICKELAPQGVIHVKRFITKRNGQLVKLGYDSKGILVFNLKYEHAISFINLVKFIDYYQMPRSISSKLFVIVSGGDTDTVWRTKS
jgi:hypothetical protein